ncbi:MAG: 4Fe-4S dicluster domain-containing protein [Clostridia bacterium]|nr:4Fe-4S dicluster domain-containing protein [Clostridia bacterium]NLF21508.1 RnfABCDGE type electron transport complex subunit B [Clostridiaceae bacterium]
MDSVILAAIVTGTSGLLLGLILAVFSKIMYVPVDKKVEELRAIMPGANCGACGHTTCDGYSEALASGAEPLTNLCKPGGADVANAVAAYLGQEASEILATTAMVMCQGNNDNTQKRVDYVGITTCTMAAQLEGGDGACRFGCLGYGDCVTVCQYDAIHVVNGVAVVNPAACTSCGMCINICPKHIIDLIPMEKASSMVLCKNEDKPADANKVCKVSCFSCRRCVKACPEQCIEIVNNRAVIDYARCTNCGKCQEVCPHSCILSLYPGGVPAESVNAKAV